jgi:hypothetical protein
MRLPTDKELEMLRERYQIGTLVVLDSMEDRQAPPPGTQGIVMGVDDLGSIMVRWETGSTLSLVPGVDSFHTETDGMEDVRRDILQIRETGRTNMFDLPQVKAIAREMKCTALLALLKKNQRKYIHFIFTGKF